MPDQSANQPADEASTEINIADVVAKARAYSELRFPPSRLKNTKKSHDEVSRALIDFYNAYGRLPKTMQEILKQISSRIRLHVMAMDHDQVDGKPNTKQDMMQWPVRKFLALSGDLSDDVMRRIPNIGDSTIAAFRMLQFVYGTLEDASLMPADASPIDAPTVAELKRTGSARQSSPLVMQWKGASAGLDKKDVIERLGFLLTQGNDIICANERSFSAALMKAAREYYDDFLPEEMITNDVNIATTRRIVAINLLLASSVALGNPSHHHKILDKYMNPWEVTSNQRHKFLRSHLAAIQDSVQQGDLDRVNLHLSLVGKVDMGLKDANGEPLADTDQGKALVDAVVETTSAAVTAFAKANRLPEALAVMDILDERICKETNETRANTHQPITSESYGVLLEAVVKASEAMPLPQVQSVLAELRIFSERRERYGQLTDQHVQLSAQIKAIEAGKHKAMIGASMARLGTTLAAFKPASDVS